MMRHWSRLIGIALEHAKRHFSACYLETLASMREAQKFYEKHGFSLTDETYGNTAHYDCGVHYIKRF